MAGSLFSRSTPRTQVVHKYSVKLGHLSGRQMNVEWTKCNNLTFSTLPSSHLLAQPAVQACAAAPGHCRPIRLQLPGRPHAEGPQEEAAGGQRHGDHRVRRLRG